MIGPRRSVAWATGTDSGVLGIWQMPVFAHPPTPRGLSLLFSASSPLLPGIPRASEST